MPRLKDPIPSLEKEDVQFFEELEKVRGPLSDAYRYMFAHPSLAKQIANLGSQLRYHSSLPQEVRVFTTVYVAKKLKGQKTFNTHSPLFKELFSEELLQDLLNIDLLPAPYKLYAESIECVLQKKKLPEGLQLDEKQLVEFVFLINFYQMLISFSFAFELEVTTQL